MMTIDFEGDEKITALANLMIETFGHRALSVAKEQMKAAEHTPSVAESWNRIHVKIAMMQPSAL